jgi:hypothetical protein
VNTQYVTPSAIEPGEEKHLLTWPKTSKCDEDFGYEDQHRLRGALVCLARNRIELGERRLHSPDDLEVEARHLGSDSPTSTVRNCSAGIPRYCNATRISWTSWSILSGVSWKVPI